jgi:hypothetical protein
MEALESAGVPSAFQVRSQNRSQRQRAVVFLAGWQKAPLSSCGGAYRVAQSGHRLPNNLMAPLRL